MRRTKIRGPLLIYRKDLRLWVLKSIGRCGHLVTACFAVEPTDDQQADAHENARLRRLCTPCEIKRMDMVSREAGTWEVGP